MPWIGGALMGGGALLGGLMGSSAAGDAADSQAASAAQSDATQRYIYDQNRADNAPFLNNGVGASNKLAQMLGISPLLSTGDNGAPTYNAQLYGSNPIYRAAWDDLAAQHQAKYGIGYTAGSDPGWIEQGIQSRMGADSSYGSLLKPVSRADIEADPVYSMGLQFGLDEGTKGINRHAAATGNMLSGATLRALTRYGNDYGTTKANDSVNRINASRQQTYSMLSGMSGGGQAAAGQTQAAGSSYANAVGQTAVGLGNARAASAIGQSNAWSGAINSGINGYQGNQLLQAIRGGGGSGNNGTIDPWSGAGVNYGYG